MNSIIIKIPNFVGDFLMALPALRFLKEELKEDCHITAIADQSIIELLTLQDCVDHIIPHEKKPSGLGRILRLSKEIKNGSNRRFDTALSLTRQFYVPAAFRLCKIPRITTFDQFDLNFTNTNRTKALGGTPPFDDCDQIDYYNSLAKAHIIETMHRSIRTNPNQFRPAKLKTPEVDLKLVKPEGKYAVFAVGESGETPTKAWPIKSFVKLSEIIRESFPEMTIVFPFGPGEGSKHQQLEDLLPSESRSGVLLIPPGKLPLAEFATLIKGSEFVVSNDSGARHLSVAVGKPTITIFGFTPQNRVVYGNLECQVNMDTGCPELTGCSDKKCKKTNGQSSYCMAAVTPKKVLDDLFQFLQPS